MHQKPLVAFPRLLVLDKDASARFYEALGFVRIATDGTFVQLRWGESGDVFLVPVPTGVNVPGRRGYGVLLCFITLELDALVAKVEALGVKHDGPELQPWHTRELVVTDPDGYRLAFVAPG